MTSHEQVKRLEAIAEGMGDLLPEITRASRVLGDHAQIDVVALGCVLSDYLGEPSFRFAVATVTELFRKSRRPFEIQMPYWDGEPRCVFELRTNSVPVGIAAMVSDALEYWSGMDAGEARVCIFHAVPFISRMGYV